MTLVILLAGLVLIATGILYWCWPTIFRRGMWMRTSIAIRSFSEENYMRYMRVLGALSVVLGLGLIVVALVLAKRAQSELGHLSVVVDPTISHASALRGGTNRGAPRTDVDTEISAKREADGAIVVDVRVVKNPYWFVSRFVLRGEPGHVECEVTTHSAQGDSTSQRWPSTNIRGSMRLNHDRLSDLTGRPLLLHSDVTGRRAGSDVSENHQIEITEADLR